MRNSVRAPMRALLSFFLLGVALVATPARAEVELIEWTPRRDGPTLLIPGREGESPARAGERYLGAVNAFPSLRALMPREAGPDAKLELPVGEASVLTTRPGELSFVVLANNYFDVLPGSVRMKSVTEQLAAHGARPLVIPVAAELALDASERAAFRELVARRADALMSVGGRDIDARWYDGDPTLSRNTNAVVDEPEIKMVQHYLRHGKGVFYGICRGAQLCSVIERHKLLQDIPTATGSEAHAKGAHLMLLAPGPSLLKEFTGFESRFRVNTSHHQAVLPREGSPLKVIATSDANGTRIVEALQTDNGRVLLVQFHPEKMEGTVGPNIMKGFVTRAAAWKAEAGQNCSGPIGRLGR